MREFPGGTVYKNLPTRQGIQVQSLVWEDPHMSNKAHVSHNDPAWSQLLKPMHPRACTKQQEKLQY